MPYLRERVPITAEALEDRAVDNDVSVTRALERNVEDAYIEVHRIPSLANATITRIDYYEDTRGTPHEFLMFTIRVDGAPHTWAELWLRLDRRALLEQRFRGVSLLSSASLSMAIRPDDTITIISNRRSLDLQGDSRPILSCTFTRERKPTLISLLKVACLISAHATDYNLWSSNCWFYAAAVLKFHRRNYTHQSSSTNDNAWKKVLKRFKTGTVNRAITAIKAPFDAWQPIYLQQNGASMDNVIRGEVQSMQWFPELYNRNAFRACANTAADNQGVSLKFMIGDSHSACNRTEAYSGHTPFSSSLPQPEAESVDEHYQGMYPPAGFRRDIMSNRRQPSDEMHADSDFQHIPLRHQAAAPSFPWPEAAYGQPLPSQDARRCVPRGYTTDILMGIPDGVMFPEPHVDGIKAYSEPMSYDSHSFRREMPSPHPAPRQPTRGYTTD